MANWIEPACKFAGNLTQTALKALLPPASIMGEGYNCNNQDLDNLALANQHTALWGLLYDLVDNAPTNQKFIDCLWNGPFCNDFADRFITLTRSGSGTANLTLPAGGTYRGVWMYSGCKFVQFPTYPWIVSELDTDGDRTYNGTLAGDFAGGTVMSIPTGAQFATLSFFGVKIC